MTLAFSCNRFFFPTFYSTMCSFKWMCNTFHYTKVQQKQSSTYAPLASQTAAHVPKKYISVLISVTYLRHSPSQLTQPTEQTQVPSDEHSLLLTLHVAFPPQIFPKPPAAGNIQIYMSGIVRNKAHIYIYMTTTFLRTEKSKQL